MMNKYIKYFKYIIKHKKNVFIECWKEGLYIHAFTHDLSKFSSKEFKAYAWKFYGGKQASRVLLELTGTKDMCISQEDVDEEFEKAWKHHYTHNKHHWEYWIGKDMPDKYIKQMICDWRGMGRKFGDTAQEFYCKNYDKIKLTCNSRALLDFNLGLIDGPCLTSNICWKEYCKRVNKTMEEDLSDLGYTKHVLQDPCELQERGE